jgi:hypothetical protein
MTCFVGLDVSQKMTAICVVDNAGHRLWRGQCPTNPEQISILVRRQSSLQTSHPAELSPHHGPAFGTGEFQEATQVFKTMPTAYRMSR